MVRLKRIMVKLKNYLLLYSQDTILLCILFLMFCLQLALLPIPVNIIGKIKAIDTREFSFTFLYGKKIDLTPT